jgi:threonine/homoserine/homoserine lactone efflux protein
MPSASAWRAGFTGFTLQISNPKAILFWMAIAGVGGVGNAPAHVIALFIAGAFVNSFVGHGAYALLLSAGPVRRLYFRGRRWIEAALGGFFAIAGYTLATSR